MNPPTTEFLDAAMNAVTVIALAVHTTVLALLIFITFVSCEIVEGRVTLSGKPASAKELIVAILMVVGTFGIWRAVL